MKNFNLHQYQEQEEYPEAGQIYRITDLKIPVDGKRNKKTIPAIEILNAHIDMIEENGVSNFSYGKKHPSLQIKELYVLIHYCDTKTIGLFKMVLVQNVESFPQPCIIHPELIPVEFREKPEYNHALIKDIKQIEDVDGFLESRQLYNPHSKTLKDMVMSESFRECLIQVS